jgi:acyl-CoA thioester hydrolase
MNYLDYKFSFKIQARWSDMDELHHINNAVYLTYLEDARGRYLHEVAIWDWNVDGIILANVNINYRFPMTFLDDAYVFVKTSKVGGKSFELSYAVVKKVNDTWELLADATTVLVMFDYKTQSSIPIPNHLKNKIIQFDNIVNN